MNYSNPDIDYTGTDWSLKLLFFRDNFYKFFELSMKLNIILLYSLFVSPKTIFISFIEDVFEISFYK